MLTSKESPQAATEKTRYENEKYAYFEKTLSPVALLLWTRVNRPHTHTPAHRLSVSTLTESEESYLLQEPIGMQEINSGFNVLRH